MTTLQDQIRQQIETLVKQGNDVLTIHGARELFKQGKLKESIVDGVKKLGSLETNYQKWYTQSLPVIQQLLPERYSEFRDQYRIEKRKEVNASTYTISDYLAGLRVLRLGEEAFDSSSIFFSRCQSQINILESALTRLDSRLVNIKGILQAQLFDDELSTARELLKKSHHRAAGAVAGVVVERHLSQVTKAHELIIHKKDPTIADLNDSLKNAGILDVPNWRFVQRLGDLRNLCVHSKGREPTEGEVEDLIQGAEKIIKTMF